MAFIRVSLRDLSTTPRTSWVKAGLGKAALKSAIGAALVMGVLGAGQAQALVVTVNSLQWDVTTFTGSYNANVSKFNTAANGGTMPWWSSVSLTSQFATAVNTLLGTNIQLSTFGPLFAYSTNTSVRVDSRAWDSLSGSVLSPFFTGAPNNTSFVWATADLVPPVPGPLPALGAAAAFGFSRELRKRIKGHNAVSTTYTP